MASYHAGLGYSGTGKNFPLASSGENVRSCDPNTSSTCRINPGTQPSKITSLTALYFSPVPSCSPSNLKKRILHPGIVRSGSVANSKRQAKFG